jgi:hypothetical protein
MKLESAISERDVGSGSLSYAQHTEIDILLLATGDLVGAMIFFGSALSKVLHNTIVQ